MTELARALKISPATCHSLLMALVEVGFLYRKSNKEFVLGPELVMLGRAAGDYVSPLQVAQPEMRALADTFDVVCSAGFLEDHVVEVRERAESISFVGSSAPLGAKFNIRIPLAAAFISWWPGEDVETWLDHHVPPPTPEQREMQYKSMDFARRYGFVLILADEAGEQRRAENGERLIVPAVALSDSESYLVISIIAPVFSSHERVAFSLALGGFHRLMSAKEILAIADQLKAACGRIGNFIAGKRLSQGPAR